MRPLPPLQAFLLLTVLGLATCGVAACGRPSGDQSSPGPLTLDDLRRTEYRSLYAQNGTVRLDNGEYRERYSDEWGTELVVRLTRHVAFLRSDTLDAAAVVLESSPGNVGAFSDLALVVKRDGRTRNTSSRFLGDRIRVDSLFSRAAEVHVHMLVHRRQDPMASPSLPVHRTFIAQGDTLTDAAADTTQGR